jgi:methylmalonyl-CoA mutase
LPAVPDSPAYCNRDADAVRGRTDQFARSNGRRPRILLGRSRDEQFDSDLKAIAAGLADLGFDVDILGVAGSPSAVARIALENDVHLVGLVGISAENGFPVEELLAALAAEDGEVKVAVWCPMAQVAGFGKRGDASSRVEIMAPAGDALRSANRLLDMLADRP